MLAAVSSLIVASLLALAGMPAHAFWFVFSVIVLQIAWTLALIPLTRKLVRQVLEEILREMKSKH